MDSDVHFWAAVWAKNRLAVIVDTLYTIVFNILNQFGIKRDAPLKK